LFVDANVTPTRPSHGRESVMLLLTLA